MRRKMQPFIGGFLVQIAKPFRRAARLVAADPDCHHVAFTQPARQLKDFGGRIRTEVAHRIEYPEKRDAEVSLPALAPALHAVKQRLNRLPSPANHPDT